MKSYRIFLVLGGRATPADNTNIWVKNLYDPLKLLGHDVYLFNIDAYAADQGLGYMSEEAKQRVSNELPRLFNQEHSKKPFDFSFTYLHNGQIIPEVLKEIKKQVFTINYSTNFHQFNMYKEVASIVDQNIYISSIAKAGFDEIGAKSYWMPLAASPEFYKPSAVKNNQAVFIGSSYGPRSYLFWRLLQYGVDLQLYGQGWLESGKTITGRKDARQRINEVLRKTVGYEFNKYTREDQRSLTDELRKGYAHLNDTILDLMRRDHAKNLHGPLNDDEYIKVLSEAGQVINIQESRFNHDYFNHNVLFGSNLRDFEATMCGSFLCTQYSTEIEQLFDIDKEIVCYHHEHDLAEKIQYYSRHTSERDAIARSGYERSLKDHTWERRFIDFFNYLKL